MLLHELVPESEATLTCKVGKDKRCFKTKVVGPYKEEKSLLVEPIRYNGFVVNFNINNIVLETQVDKNKAMVFRVDKIQNVIVKGQTYHLLISEEDASAINRRDYVRVPLGVECTLRYGLKRTEVNCYVHDISATGISFNIKEQVDIKRGDEISCSFVYGENRTLFKIFATVVRTQENEKNGFLIVGAKYKSVSDALQKFVMELQREAAQKRNS